MWAGWDYLEEAGIGAWSYDGGLPFARPYPWIIGGAGVIGITGVPDLACRYAQTVWGKLDAPALGVRPVNHPGKRVTKSVWRGTNAIGSWAWHGCDGNKACVEVYADSKKARSVELFLNEKSLGRKRLKNYQAIYKISYIPGRLEATSYDSTGKPIGRQALLSAEGSLHLSAVPETEGLPSYEKGAVVFFDISIRGENDIVKSNADENLTLTAAGCELLGFGSANPCTAQRYDSGTFATYYGRALAAVRVTDPERLSLTVRGETLGETNVDFR